MTTTMAESKEEEAVSNNNPLQQAKQLVWQFHTDLEKCSPNDTQKVLEQHTLDSTTYCFRSVYPFRQLQSASTVASRFWKPLKQSFTKLQRRPDIFIAGQNSLHNDDTTSVWVLSMGHFLGLFDEDWLGIRYTRQLACLRYAEFTEVCLAENKVIQTGLFLDIVGLMQQVGMNPLPPSTGVNLGYYPGPRTQDGILLDKSPPLEQAQQTQQLVDRMVDDLSAINGSMTCSPDILRKTWHEDMAWYGPAGIGCTYTIERYQEQHQLPFRAHLGNKKFHGHVVRMAEGNYAAFFGWPMNLTNTPLGGFLGLPASCDNSPMQVVDVYRRDGDKLAENWVLIDLLWYLKHQGVDVLERTTGILNPTVSSTNSKFGNDNQEEEDNHVSS